MGRAETAQMVAFRAEKALKKSGAFMARYNALRTA
jgi:hypothetical protein